MIYVMKTVFKTKFKGSKKKCKTVVEQTETF